MKRFLGIDLTIIIGAGILAALWYFGVKDFRRVATDADRERYMIIEQVKQNTQLLKALSQAAGIDSALIETPMLDSLLLDTEDSLGNGDP